MAKKRKEPASIDPDDIVQAMLQHQLMEETAAYLSRGRPFQEVGSDELNQRWTTTAKAWFADGATGQSEHHQVMNDLGAELRLRELLPPWETVQQEVNLAMAEVAQAGPDDPGVRAAIQQFLDAWNKPHG